MKTRSSRTDSSREPRAAFSRWELLAVIAALAALTLTVMPALGQAKAKASRILCVSNQEILARAFRVFAVDHDDRFPMSVRVSEGGTSDYLGTTGAGGAADTWRHFAALQGTLESAEVLRCPADSGRFAARTWEELAQGSSAKNRAISYGVGTEATPARPGMLLLADRSITWFGGRVPLEYNAPQALRGNLGTNAGALATLEWDYAGMHVNGGNGARADGSVWLLDSPALREVLIQSGDSRNNYAQPGSSTR